MKIVLVMPFYSESAGAPHEMLARFPLIRELPASLAQRGHQVRVLSLAASSCRLEHGGARYEFHSPGRLIEVAGRGLHRWKPRYGPAYYQPSWSLIRRLRRLDADVVHVFGLTMDLQLAALLVGLKGRAPVVAHYHGGLPAESPLLRRVQRSNVRRLARVCFTSTRQADPWIEADLLRPDQVARVMETSSPFSPIPREEARRRTGMSGDPVCLSAGRLEPVKDPLTMLRGFARVAAVQPGARLYCYYLTDDLLPEMRRLVEADPTLAGRVEFRGRAPLAEMAAIYSSADFLIQASTREWSGLAVLEAMSCGCIPVITRIPAFEAMTAGGRWGRLFETGDAADLARAILDLTPADLADLSTGVRQHFERELSFRAIAGRLEAVYAEVADRR